MQAGVIDTARVSVAEQIGSARRSRIDAGEFARRCEAWITTALQQRAPVLFVGIGRYSNIGALMLPLARYPGQVVIIGAADVALPGYANFLCIEVPDDAPLGAERFMFARAESWAELLVAEPDGAGFRTATADAAAVVERVTALMLAFAPAVAPLIAPAAESASDPVPPADDLPATAELSDSGRLRAQIGEERAAIVALKRELADTQAIRAQIEAERAAVLALEEELLREQELRAQIEGQLVVERKARLTFEQTTLADLDRLLAQERAAREERARQLEYERATEQTVTQEMRQSLAQEQEASRDLQRQLFSLESEREQFVARLAELQAESSDAQRQWAEISDALEAARGAADEIAAALAHERDHYAQLESQWTQLTAARANIEAQIAREPELHADAEARLGAAQAARADIEAWIAHLLEEREQLGAALDIERASLTEAQRGLEAARAEREYAEYAAIHEVAADDGLAAGSFVRDLRLFMVRLRERIAQLNDKGGTRPLTAWVAEITTVIEILTEIGVIAGREAGGRRLSDVGAAIHTILSESGGTAAERGVALQAGVIAPHVTAVGDSETLTAALQAAILSAIHLSAAGGSVRVDMGANANSAQVQIVFRADESSDETGSLERYLLHFEQGVPRRSLLAGARTILLHHRGRIGFRRLEDGRTALSLTIPTAAS